MPLSDFPAQRRCHHCFDGVHAVFCLVEYNRRVGFKDFIRYFHLIDTEALSDFSADLGVAVMVRRQAMHENRIPGILHHFAVYLIRHQVFDTLHPYRIRLAHRTHTSVQITSAFFVPFSTSSVSVMLPPVCFAIS